MKKIRLLLMSPVFLLGACTSITVTDPKPDPSATPSKIDRMDRYEMRGMRGHL